MDIVPQLLFAVVSAITSADSDQNHLQAAIGAWKKNLARIESLDVGYKIENVDGGGRPRMLAWTWCDGRIRIRGVARRWDMSYPKTLGSGGKRADPSHDVFTWDGRRASTRNVQGRTMFLNDEIGNRLYWAPYLECFGASLIADPEKWPLLDRPFLRTIDPKMAIDRRLSEGVWNVRAPSKGSTLCVFQSSDGESITLDTSKAYALVERSFDNSEGTVRRIINEEFQECLPGFWAPVRSRIQLEQPGKTAGELKVDATHVRMNGLTAQDVKDDPPPGTQIYDVQTKKVWKYLPPGDEKSETSKGQDR